MTIFNNHIAFIRFIRSLQRKASSLSSLSHAILLYITNFHFLALDSELNGTLSRGAVTMFAGIFFPPTFLLVEGMMSWSSHSASEFDSLDTISFLFSISFSFRSFILLNFLACYSISLFLIIPFIMPTKGMSSSSPLITSLFVVFSLA